MRSCAISPAHWPLFDFFQSCCQSKPGEHPTGGDSHLMKSLSFFLTLMGRLNICKHVNDVSHSGSTWWISVVFVTWLMTWMKIQTHLSLSFVLKSISSLLLFSRLQTLALIYDASLLMCTRHGGRPVSVCGFGLETGRMCEFNVTSERQQFNIISSLSRLGHS